jgi:hypothetical protein
VTLPNSHEMAALQAMQVLVVAVDFHNFFTACSLVQVVDVLGDYSIQVAIFLEIRESKVTTVRFFADKGPANPTF